MDDEFDEVNDLGTLEEMSKFVSGLLKSHMTHVIPGENSRFEDKHFVYVDDGLTPVMNDRPIETLDSTSTLGDFIQYVEQEIKSDEGVIFVSKSKINAYFDFIHRNYGHVNFNLLRSNDLKSWEMKFNQQQLIEFVQQNASEILDFGFFDVGEFKSSEKDIKEILMSLYKIRISKNTSFESSIDQSNSNISVAYSETDGSKSTSDVSVFPVIWKINIPYYEGTPSTEMFMKMSFNKPKEEGEKPIFTFRLLFESIIIKEEVEKISDKLKECLSGYRIYQA